MPPFPYFFINYLEKNFLTITKRKTKLLISPHRQNPKEAKTFGIRMQRSKQLPDRSEMVAPLIAGIAVAAAAYAGRYSIKAWQAFKARPPTARVRRFYEGGFQPSMNRREAALILGVRESTPAEKIKEAHRRVMVANHPDAGGSHYLASKINEAKDVMLGRTKGSGSAF